MAPVSFVPSDQRAREAKAVEMQKFVAALTIFRPVARDKFTSGNAIGFFQHSYMQSRFALDGTPIVRISSQSPVGISWNDTFDPKAKMFLYLLPHVEKQPGVVEPDAIADLLKMRGRPVRVVFAVGHTATNSGCIYESSKFRVDPAYDGGDGVRIVME